MEIKRVDDYIDRVQERFPDLSKKEIEEILRFGFKAYYLLNLYGADVLIKSNESTSYTGSMFRDRKKFWNYWGFKSALKLRIKHKRKRKPYDGYYYFGLSEEQYKKYNLDQKNGREFITFDELYIYKIKEEPFLQINNKYFYKLAIKEDGKYADKLTNYKTSQFSLIAKRDSNGEIKFV